MAAHTKENAGEHTQVLSGHAQYLIATAARAVSFVRPGHSIA